VFGWSYPAGCTGTPYDDEAHELLGHVECEACAEWRETAEAATECCADEEDEDDTEGGE
jgi:hypothetical protein